MRRVVDVWGFCAAPSLLKSMVLASMLLASACDGDSKGEGGGDSSEPVAELSCSGIFGCLGECATDDSPCADACVDNGSAAGVEAAVGVAVCADENACADEDCLVASCEAEIIACLATSPDHTGGEPPPSEVPAGSVPAELVGQWRSPEESYLFREDGTVSRDLHIDASYCGADALEHGVAVADGETLTIYFLEGEVSTCGSEEPYQPYTEVFGYYFRSEGLVLVLTGGNCTANCETGFDKQ